MVREERKRDDDSDWKFKYQSRGLLKLESEEIVMDENQEEFYCCREQEAVDDWVSVRDRAKDIVKGIARAAVGTEQAKAKVKAGAKATTKVVVRVHQIRTQQVEVEFQQSRWRSTQQSEDILDKEIEFMRRLMVKVSEKKAAVRKQRSRSSNKRKTKRECKIVASGAR